MHELGIVFNIIKSVETVAEENQLKDIAAVVLEVGEVSTIIDHYLLDCWKWAIQKTQIMQEAELKIEHIDALTYCEDCEETYGTVEHGKICPICGSENTFLAQGSEVIIKEIEVRE